MISSRSNPRVKYVKRLQSDRRFRDREKLFVLEGTRLLSDSSAFPSAISAIFYTEAWQETAHHEALLARINQPREMVTEEVMAAMSATESPSGVLALATMDLRPLPQDPSLVLILDGLATPGNMGSIFRSAAAAAVDALLLAPGCVDPYNPKVIRGAMGAHFRLPFRQMDWPAIADYCAGTKIWLTEPQGTVIYSTIEWRQPSTLIIGSEAHGASLQAKAIAAGSVKIPMAQETESLNATAAASIILFEAFRQRGFA